MSLPDISLPTDDASIAELAPELRGRIGQRWRSRAKGELSTANTFTHVARALMEAGAVPDVLWMSAKAISDEVRHAEVCRRVAEAYLGRTLELPPADKIDVARFGNADARLNGLLLVVSHSCVNEGIALAYLQEQLRLVQSKLVRAALQEFLRDDVNHARIGWAHLASFATSEKDKQRVAKAMPRLLRMVTELWLAPMDDAVDCPEHGCLGLEHLPELVRATLEELVLPGFEHVGVSSEHGRAWFEKRFSPTRGKTQQAQGRLI